MENENEVNEPVASQEGDKDVSQSSEKEAELANELAKTKEQLQKAEDAIVASKRKAKEGAEEEPPTPEGEPSTIDPFEFAKEMSALHGYSREELEHIQKYAQANRLKPQEAVSVKELQEFIGWKRDKVAKENKIPDSSSPDASSEIPSDKDIQKMSEEDFQTFEKEFVAKKEQESGV